MTIETLPLKKAANISLSTSKRRGNTTHHPQFKGGREAYSLTDFSLAKPANTIASSAYATFVLKTDRSLATDRAAKSMLYCADQRRD
jgi:hypothetical protein